MICRGTDGYDRTFIYDSGSAVARLGNTHMSSPCSVEVGWYAYIWSPGASRDHSSEGSVLADKVGYGKTITSPTLIDNHHRAMGKLKNHDSDLHR